MSDHRSQPSAGAESGDSSPRDDQQPEEHTVELSASDILSVQPAEAPTGPMSQVDAETTQVLELRRLQAAARADDVRTTSEAQAHEETTSAFDIPAELLERMESTIERPRPRERADSAEVVSAPNDDPKTLKLEAVSGPPTEKFQAVGTRPLPRVSEPDEDTNSHDTTSEYAPGQFVEMDEEGFATFIARTEADGSIALPDAVFGDASNKEGLLVFVKLKALGS